MVIGTLQFEDAHSVREWRGKGFQSVLNERADTFEVNRAYSSMTSMFKEQKNACQTTTPCR